MSAFIVDSATLDQIVSTLAFGTVSCNQEISHLAGKSGLDLFDSYWITPPAAEISEDFARLAYDLHLLNVAAVNDRYREKIDPDYTPRIQRENVRPLMIAFKLTQCLLYQCNEGQYHKTPLFKALQSFEGFLGAQIAQTLPAYDSAPWG